MIHQPSGWNSTLFGTQNLRTNESTTNIGLIGLTWMIENEAAQPKATFDSSFV